MWRETNVLQEWKVFMFTEVVEVNPKRSLKKGEECQYIEMKSLLPNHRKVEKIDKRAYKGGGSRFRNGDTLFARITPCLENGKIAFINELDPGQAGYGSTEFIVMSGKEGVTDNLFVYYLSRWGEIRGFAIKNMTGTSGRQRVPNDIFKQRKIYLPPLPEQRRIASILSAFDDKIELNNQMNRTLEEMASAVFESWFVDFEPFQDGEFEYSEELEREIPKGWEVGVLNDVLSELESGNRPKGGVDMYSEGIASIGAENILGLGRYDYSKNKFVPSEFFDKMKTGIIKSGDVLLYKDGAKLGRKSLFMAGFPLFIEHIRS